MCKAICSLLLSRPAWGAWIEIERVMLPLHHPAMSRPAWGAWIEIPMFDWYYSDSQVAPRMGRVD